MLAGERDQRLEQEGKEPGKRPALRRRLWAWTGFADKTLWEWLQLLGSLAIPLVLALAGFWFTSQQEKSGQVVEEQRAQDAALQAYLDQMGTLLLTEELRKSEEGSEVRTLARARTITVLERLDSRRTAAVIEFLIEAELAQLIELSGTNLSGANLSGANLSSANLSSANLNGTNLTGANLSSAALIRANLSGAYLDDADLSGADLSYADLSDADLFGADLSEADLSYADLSGAEGVIKERLEQQAGLLHGATMPDGMVLPERYVTSEFKPALSFSLSDEWELNSPETPDLISFAGPERERGGLNFIKPLQVFDSSNPSEPIEGSALKNADEWVSWFQKHQDLDTSKPVLMSVGGESAVRIDATFTPKTDSGTAGPGCPCVPLFRSSGGTIVSRGATKDRFIIVDVSEGETVIIQVSAPTGAFDGFLPEAQKVLDSVEWNGR